MAEEETLIHKKFGIKFNNQIWDYLARPKRTPEEDQEMIQLAYASLLHWRLFEGHKTVNIQRGQYMIAKAHFYANELDIALQNATRCLETTTANLDEMADFDVAYAYQILAAIYLSLGNSTSSDKYLSLAKEACCKIANLEDRKFVEKDIEKDMKLQL